jgi:hypothetical protein
MKIYTYYLFYCILNAEITSNSDELFLKRHTCKIRQTTMLRKFFFRLSSSQTIFGNLLSFKEISGKNPIIFNSPLWIFVFSNLEDFISGRSDGSIGGLRHNLGLDPASIVLPDHLHKQYCIPDQLHKQYCFPKSWASSIM